MVVSGNPQLVPDLVDRFLWISGSGERFLKGKGSVLDRKFSENAVTDLPPIPAERCVSIPCPATEARALPVAAGEARKDTTLYRTADLSLACLTAGALSRLAGDYAQGPLWIGWGSGGLWEPAFLANNSVFSNVALFSRNILGGTEWLQSKFSENLLCNHSVPPRVRGFQPTFQQYVIRGPTTPSPQGPWLRGAALGPGRIPSGDTNGNRHPHRRVPAAQGAPPTTTPRSYPLTGPLRMPLPVMWLGD